MTLALVFLITALLYASVGFGGGSTYNALLVLEGADYRLVPLIALGCNITVTSVNVWRFSTRGLVPFRRLLPFLWTSIPAAWWGGRAEISEKFFVGLLGSVLVASGVRLAMQRESTWTSETPRSLAPPTAAIFGALIGLIAGLAGIGGGILLAPLLYFLRWGNPSTIAATCSAFILVNSAFGAAGQLAKLHNLALLRGVAEYWSLAPTVMIGGQLGAWMAARKLPAAWVKNLTALLIVYVGFRLVWHFTRLA